MADLGDTVELAVKAKKRGAPIEDIMKLVPADKIGEVANALGISVTQAQILAKGQPDDTAGYANSDGQLQVSNSKPTMQSSSTPTVAQHRSNQTVKQKDDGKSTTQRQVLNALASGEGGFHRMDIPGAKDTPTGAGISIPNISGSSDFPSVPVPRETFDESGPVKVGSNIPRNASLGAKSFSETGMPVPNVTGNNTTLEQEQAGSVPSKAVDMSKLLQKRNPAESQDGAIDPSLVFPDAKFAVPLPNVESSNMPLAQEDASKVPVQAIDMSKPPQQRSKAESQGSQGGTSNTSIPTNAVTDWAGGIADRWANLPETVKDKGLVGWGVDMGSHVLGPVGSAYDFAKDLAFGWGDEQQKGPSQEEKARQQAMEYEISSGGQAASSGGQTASGGQSASGQAGSGPGIGVPQKLVPSGEEAYPAMDVPQFTEEDKQAAMERLRALEPGQFEREDASMAEVLGGMGQQLGSLGRAPGLGQALLALGTGSSQAVAANEAEQDRLARQHAERQRAHERMLAEKGIQLDQKVLQGKQRQYQADRELQKLRQQQDNARMQQFNEMSEVQATDDQIVIRTPATDENGNFTGEMKTRVIDKSGPEERQRLDGLMTPVDEDTPSRGTVGSQDVNDAMKGLNPQEKLTYALTAPLTADRHLSVPGTEEMRQQINKQAEQEVRKRYGIEGEAPLGEAARTLDVSYEELQDQIEEAAWVLHRKAFQSDRRYRAAAMEAAQIPEFKAQAQAELEAWKQQQAGAK